MNLSDSARHISYRVLALLGIVLLSTFGLSGCGGSSSAPRPAATLQSISVNLPAAQLTIGTTRQLQIQAKLLDGGTQDVTSQATYSSSAPLVATISSSAR